MSFEDFWSTFPRRVAKIKARTAYDKALKLTTPEKILEAAKKYAAERIGKDAAFTKHPTTWLNGGCWDDYEDTAPLHPAEVPPGVYLKFSERDVWDSYGRRIGKTWPRDKAGGWWFPARTPPEAT